MELGKVYSEKKRVCVTGAGGYVGSWVVKALLSKGYIVHGTVRDPCDQTRHGHLKKLENAAESLHLFQADLLDYKSLCAAIQGCSGVFHLACPVPGTRRLLNPEVDMFEPAIKGTQNVLKACLNANVKKVVVVSSAAAVMMTPKWPKDQAMDESCWSDIEYCKTAESWYCAAKTVAEKEAWDYAKNNGLNMVTVCPSIAIGPMLQTTLNASCSFLLRYMKGTKERVENVCYPYVDVRETAEAIVLAYEKPEAEGRYICSSFSLHTKELVEKLQSMFTEYKYPSIFNEVEKLNSMELNSGKLENLGWSSKPLEETLMDAVKNFQEKGLLV